MPELIMVDNQTDSWNTITLTSWSPFLDIAVNDKVLTKVIRRFVRLQAVNTALRRQLSIVPEFAVLD